MELQKVETVNGNPKIAEDEEATVGGDGEDLVDYIPGKELLLFKTLILLADTHFRFVNGGCHHW